MPTDKSHTEVLQQMIDDLRHTVDEVEYTFQEGNDVFKKRKADHIQKVEETTNEGVEKLKASQNSDDINDLASTMQRLKREANKQKEEEAQRIKDLQTSLQSSVMTDLEMVSEQIKVHMMDVLVGRAEKEESFVLNKRTLKELYDNTQSTFFPAEKRTKNIEFNVD